MRSPWDESTLVLNLPIMIGPGMNIHRHGYNARGAEYYSEDPVLSGYTGSAVVQGAQSKGTWSTSSTPPSTIRRSTAPASQSL